MCQQFCFCRSGILWKILLHTIAANLTISAIYQESFRWKIVVYGEFSDFAASSAEICEMKYFDELLEEYIKM